MSAGKARAWRRLLEGLVAIVALGAVALGLAAVVPHSPVALPGPGLGLLVAGLLIMLLMSQRLRRTIAARAARVPARLGAWAPSPKLGWSAAEQWRAGRGAERRYQALVETVPAVVYSASVEHTPVLRYVSPQAEQILGFTPEELQGTLLLPEARIHPDDRVRALDILLVILSGGTPFASEYRFLSKSGEYVWVTDQAYLLRDRQGRPVALQGMRMDITARKRTEVALQTSQFRNKALLDAIPDIMLRVSLDLVVMEYKPARGPQPYFPDNKPVVTRSLGDVLGEAFSARVWIYAERAQATGEAQVFEHAYCDDVEQWHVEVRVIYSENTDIWLILRDITARKRVEAQLRQAAIVFENTEQGVIITDPDGRIIAANRAFARITGHPRDSLRGSFAFQPRIHHPETRLYRRIWRSLHEAGSWQGEITGFRRDNTPFPGLLNMNAVVDPGGGFSHYVGVLSDLTEIKESQARLDYLAHHDYLTDLPNRMLLHDRIEHAINRAHRRNGKVAVVYIDLDHFKNINDSLGHPVGDAVIKEIASRLRDEVAEDHTVARLGGDEFVLVLEAPDGLHGVVRTVESAQEVLCRAIHINRFELFVTASLGISVFPDDGEDAMTLIKHADSATFSAKESGRNTYRFYTKGLTEAAVERLTLETQLRKALSRNEFYLLFQPQIDLRENRVIGAEVLLRWRQGSDQIIPPSRFIPVAEQSRLIEEIGRWVLESACQHMSAFARDGHENLHLAVNISAIQLVHRGFVDQVAGLIDSCGLSEGQLELEITESVLMSDPEQTLGDLTRLKEMGVSIAVDDFGTGYSSLSYLKRFPVDRLKIDQSFVRDIIEDSNDAAISRAIVSMGHSLQLTVIAEGVERADQEIVLKGYGCDEAQGYHYSKPLHVEDFLGFVKRFNGRRQGQALG